MLGDFGLAFWSTTPGKPLEHVKIRGYVGTPGYMAPEQGRHEPYDYKVDIFALGCTFVELFGRLSRPWLYQLPGIFSLPNNELETALHSSVRKLVTNRRAPMELLLWVSRTLCRIQRCASSNL